MEQGRSLIFNFNQQKIFLVMKVFQILFFWNIFFAVSFAALFIFSFLKIFSRATFRNAESWLQLSPLFFALPVLLAGYLKGVCASQFSLAVSMCMFMTFVLPKVSLVARTVMTLAVPVTAIPVLALLPQWAVFLWLAMALSLSYGCGFILKFRNIKGLIKTPSMYLMINDSVCSLLAVILISIFATGTALAASVSEECCAIVTTILELPLFVILYIRYMRGEMLCLDRGRMVRVEEAAFNHYGEDFFTSCEVNNKTLFDMAVSLMEDDELFLDPELNLNSLAHKLVTNKVYLSSMINKYSGKGYCQFVNEYRVKYAIKLFSNDPYLRVNQLADQSGFRSVSAFNMAFKLLKHMTPSEWCKEFRKGNKK